MAMIRVRSRDGVETSYRFDGDVLRIGRSAENDLVLRDGSLSRFHAELRRAGSGWTLIDLGSRNGTRKNGRAVGREDDLRDGDVIDLGELALVFFVNDAPAAPRSSTDSPTLSIGERRLEPGAVRMIGSSPAHRSLLDLVDRVAPSPSTVLVTGESGTGKELVARLLHARSSRASGPFVVVNCPALPGSLLEAELFGVEKGVATGVDARVGKFEAAVGGTLFLDEIGDMDAAAQAKILRTLQERTVERLGSRAPLPVDVRVVAATHHDLERDVRDGRFRRDLFHRLNVLRIEVPPLRERREDVGALIDWFLGEAGGIAMSAEARTALEAWNWPGNVRELLHTLERARMLARSGSIQLEDLPRDVAGGASESPSDVPARLWRRVVEGGESFWDVVQGPFLRREISREDVRALVARLHRDHGGSYKAVAAALGIGPEHKRLLNFIHHHRLGVDRGPGDDDVR